MFSPQSAKTRTATLIPWLALVVLVPACNKNSHDASDEDRSGAAPDTAESAAKQLAQSSPVDARTYPGRLAPLKHPENNPSSPAKVALGHQLFFDARLSVDGSRSCYSCHKNEDGNGGHEPTAIGAKGKPLSRHSPTIWNVGYLPRLYWDGRAESLEAQVLGAWSGGNMGVGKEGLDAKAKEIGAIPGYQKQFAAVFGTEGATAENIARAISAYERTLICDTTAFDRYAEGDKGALTAKQKRGLELFSGNAGCQTCHSPPHFSSAFTASEGTYYNLGIGTQGKAKVDVDPGRQAVTKDAKDWANFKVPTLRNISKTAPYFHDGSVATLEQAVRLVASGGHANENLTSFIRDRGLGDADISALVAFLGALDCEKKLEEPKLP